MKTHQKKEQISWFRRFFGLKDNDSRKDPTTDWFVLPPKTPAGSMPTLTNQPPSPPKEEKEI